MRATNRKQPIQYLDDLALETAFYEGIVRRLPDYVEALLHLGECYCKQGRWKRVLKVDQRLVKLCPFSPLIRYNLACSYSLLQMLPQALVALKDAIDLGFDDFAWMARDPDLQNLRRWLEEEPDSRAASHPGRTVPGEKS